MTGDGDYAVTSTYLHPSGSLRQQGGKEVFATKESALKHVKRVKRIKRKKKGFEPCKLLDVPEAGKEYLKPHVDTYMAPDEMLKLMAEAEHEYYVEFDCVVGYEERFDEGVEYLAHKDEEDEEYFNVYDRYGEICLCHITRFSRCERTERALEVMKLTHDQEQYACPACKDSLYGCANCTS